MADYEDVVRIPLKLKGNAELEAGIKKKKKSKKVDPSKMAAAALQHMQQAAHQQQSTQDTAVDDSPGGKVYIQKTKAQLAFEKMQEKRQMQKILEKASKTHKQRVEEFNRHLDSLTEHYDIPKVSWTK